MSKPIFVDANIIMYVVGSEHPLRQPCQDALSRIIGGEIQAVVSCEIHQEILHRYTAIHYPDKARQVSQKLEIAIPHTLPVTMQDITQARELLKHYPTLPARDLLHVAVMLNNGITQILSADTHFDQVEEVERLAPAFFAAE